MSLSGHWWESSSPLLTLIGTIAGVVAVLAAIWAALYASRPRRGLAYSAKIRLPTAYELAALPNDAISEDAKPRTVTINALPEDAKQRTVTIIATQENVKPRPIIITFTLRGAGRLDVPTAAFDNGTPITLSVKDADIRGIVSVNTRGGGGLILAQQVRNNKLEIGPGLISRNQILTYTLIGITKNQLKSGKAHVTLTNALIDTRLRTDKRQTVIGIGVTIAILGILLGLWYGWLRHTSAAKGKVDPFSLAGLIVALASLSWTIWMDNRKSKGTPTFVNRSVRIILDRKSKPSSEKSADQQEKQRAENQLWTFNIVNVYATSIDNQAVPYRTYIWRYLGLVPQPSAALHAHAGPSHVTFGLAIRGCPGPALGCPCRT